MRRLHIAGTFLIAAIPLLADAESRGEPFTPTQLTNGSTLVVEATVLNVATAQEYKVSFPTKVEVIRVLKGKTEAKVLEFGHKPPGKYVIFPEEYNTPVVGQRGTVFLQEQILIGYIAATATDARIDEAAARKLAIDQYNQLFKDKFIFNPVDAKHHQFPQLDAKYFHKAEIKDGCWQLALDPPAGWFVYAKVSLDGKWVQLTSVGFSTE